MTADRIATIDERERALAKLESLLTSAPVGIAFFDHDLRFRRCNHALAALIDELPGDAVGRRLRDVLPDLADRFEPVLDEVLASGTAMLDLEVAVNPTCTCMVHFFPVRLGETVIGVGATFLDLTERKRIEDELRAAVRTREDVLAVVSHDLRSPVATIQLTSTLLVQTLGTEPRVRKHLEVLQRSIARLQHLLDDLVDSVNIRAGRISLELNRQSAEAVMNEAVDLQEPLATERAIEIERAAAVAGLQIHCDRHRILQVFGNLIGNALKFCRAGDTIKVSANKLADEVMFSVKDTGPGIPAENLSSLFNPYRERARHTTTGSGLGLHICKGIVERHGGRIWIDSQPGNGTTVYFTLPIA